MKRLAIFVDAGYFWVQTTTVVRGKKTPRHEVVLDYPALRRLLLDTAKDEFTDTHLLRVYWYDGPGNGGKAEEHRSIEDMDDFKLRLGTRNSAGQQKAVDGLIIADIIGLAQNRAISEALIVSGDADLTPGVVAAQGLGLRVHLLTIGAQTATSAYLKAEVDRKCFWREDTVLQFARAASIPTVDVSSPAETTPLGPGTPQAGIDVSIDTPQPSLGNATLPTEDNLLRIAQQCYDDILPENRSALQAGLGIPKEIDSKLLSLARKTFRSQLADKERHALRNMLKELSHKSEKPISTT